VRVSLYGQATPGNTAWDEEMADCLEATSTMVSALAAEFSIVQARIEIRRRHPRGGAWN
jgi:hypothetical protein